MVYILCVPDSVRDLPCPFPPSPLTSRRLEEFPLWFLTVGGVVRRAAYLVVHP